MNIDQIMFPQGLSSQQTDENDKMKVNLKQLFPNNKIPESQNLPQDQVIEAPGQLYWVSVPKSENRKIPVQYERSATESPLYMIQFHSNSDDLGKVQKIIQNFNNNIQLLNFNMIVVEYPKQGIYRFDNEITDSILFEDSMAVQDWVKNHFQLDDTNIVLQGRSIGASVALRLTCQHNPLTAIIVCPFLSVRELINDQQCCCIQKQFKNQFNPEEQIGQLKCKILILHLTNDEIISLRHAKILKDMNPEQIELNEINNFTHNEFPNNEIHKQIKKFFEKNDIINNENNMDNF